MLGSYGGIIHSDSLSVLDETTQAIQFATIHDRFTLKVTAAATAIRSITDPSYERTDKVSASISVPKPSKIFLIRGSPRKAAQISAIHKLATMP